MTQQNHGKRGLLSEYAHIFLNNGFFINVDMFIFYSKGEKGYITVEDAMFPLAFMHSNSWLSCRRIFNTGWDLFRKELV